MRISWLEPETARKVRDVLSAWHSDWDSHFESGDGAALEFCPVPAPPGLASEVGSRWQHVTEHVARAERVSQVIREHGLERAVERFGASEHAIEHATLIAASLQMEIVPMDSVFAVLRCPVDVLVMYGPFLQLMDRVREDDLVVAVELYRAFCVKVMAVQCDGLSWPERVRMVQDGLAVFYIRCDRLDDSQEIFVERHAQEMTNLTVSLTASRAFLAAGELAHAVDWLGRGADRADRLGRASMASKLREKRTRLLARMDS